MPLVYPSDRNGWYLPPYIVQLGGETAVTGYCHLSIGISADKQMVGENTEPTPQKHDTVPSLLVYLSDNVDYLPGVVQ